MTLNAIVTQGHSLAFGARFLKRAIDERIKLPISVHWRESSHFHVRMSEGGVVVDPNDGYGVAQDSAGACRHAA